jgi:hypothetical protein
VTGERDHRIEADHAGARLDSGSGTHQPLLLDPAVVVLVLSHDCAMRVGQRLRLTRVHVRRLLQRLIVRRLLLCLLRLLLPLQRLGGGERPPLRPGCLEPKRLSFVDCPLPLRQTQPRRIPP